MNRPTAISLVLAGMILTLIHVVGQESPGSAPASNSSAAVQDITLTGDNQGVRIDVITDRPVVPEKKLLDHPDRVVFDFPGYGLQCCTHSIQVNRGPVIAVRASLFKDDPPTARVVIDLKQPLEPEVRSEGNHVRIRIQFKLADANSPHKDTEPLPSSAAESASPNLLPQVARPNRELSARTRTNRSANEYELLARAEALTLGDLSAIEQKAESGDPEAETLLALAYHSGVLLKNDEAEALRLLHKAADQEFLAAQESLGIFYAAGIGMEQANPAEALAWYSKAARRGSVDAATNMAGMYAMGEGIPKDLGTAIQWFRQAAEAGGATAQYNLALFYGRGEGVPRDDGQSLYWLTKAADQGMIAALLDLGDRYVHPADGSSPDMAAALRRYERAGDLGDAFAQALLGDIFSNGTLVKADYEQAVKWYRLAADQGQRDGEFGLAARYVLGQGVPANQKEALRWFKAAADQGHGNAQYNLGRMYEVGQGTDPDPSEAVHYYQLAAQQGVVKAQYCLGMLLTTGNSAIAQDRVSAYKWLMLAQDSVRASGPALNDLRRSMSATEITDAEHQVDAWRTARKQSRP